MPPFRETHIFTGDSYDTPADAPKSLLFRLLLKSRWYFYARNFHIFYRTGKFGLRGELTKERQIAYSNRNVTLVEECGGHIHVRGMDNLRSSAGEPVVFIGNHMSLLETALMHALIREYFDFTFVVKKQLTEIPFFKGIMRSMNAIAVGRSNPRDDLRAVMDEGKKHIDAGHSVVIFPQHTRSAVFDPSKFNTIGVKLAKHCGVRVIPFALKTDFLETGKVLRDLGPVHPERDVWFEFGAPQTVEGNGQELQRRIIDFISGRLAVWQGGEESGR